MAWLATTHEPVQAATNTPAPQPTPVRTADASCRTCHRAIYDSYLRTPKANGSGLASEALIPGTYTHTASGTTYTVEAGQKANPNIDPNTEPATPTLTETVPAQHITAKQQLLYYLGSGNLGRTYLYSTDGYLLESPVAWFSSLRGYSMAPGLAAVTSMPAALPMNARCMRCHMSDVQQPLPGVGNRFAGLPFLHSGITCEQCHGDTAHHVATWGKEPTVNLATLPAPARDSVCIRCHLEGDTSVELPGKSVFDYRPGQDIRQYLTYFIDPSNHGRSVTEVEQLQGSICKRTSGDRMSCTTCHDPHSRPESAERVAYFRGKCLTCHTGATFAQTHHPENPDCTACHMPRSEVRDTPHVAWTDHRILKLPDTAAASATTTATTSTTASAATLHPILPGQTVTARERGLAFYNLLLKGHAEWSSLALTSLEEAVTHGATDAPTENALASLYQQRGRAKDAQRLYAQAIGHGSQDMEAASNLAMLYARAGDLTTAQSVWSQAYAHAADQESIGLNLATADCLQGKATEAAATLRNVLRFSPASQRARDQLQSITNTGCVSR